MKKGISSVNIIHHDKGSVWHQVLASGKSRNVDKQDSYIILLGNNGVGRSSLIRCLQEIGNVDNSKNHTDYYKNTEGVAAIDYAYLNFCYLEREENLSNFDIVGRCNIWMIQNEKYKDILLDLLRDEEVSTLMVGVICLDLSQAHSLLSDFHKWVTCLTQIYSHLINRLSVDQQDTLKNKLSAYISTYNRNSNRHMNEELYSMQTENNSINFNASSTSNFNFNRALSTSTISKNDNNTNNLDTLKSQQSLLLNLGIPIIVVVCKSDTYTALDTRNTQGMIEMIQAYLRKACLPYGASLIFTSCKDPQQPKNVHLLYRYLTHLLYGFSFSEPPDVTSKDTLFIPFGYDSEEKLKEFASKTVVPDLDKSYEILVTKPVLVTEYDGNENNTAKEEPMEEFLSKLLMQFPASELRGTFTSQLSSENSALANKHNATNQVFPKSSVNFEKYIMMSQKRSSISEQCSTNAYLDTTPLETSTRRNRVTIDQTNMLPPKRYDSKETVSLQNFFQNLLAKNRGKGITTPRDRITRRERPEQSSSDQIESLKEEKEKDAHTAAAGTIQNSQRNVVNKETSQAKSEQVEEEFNTSKPT